MEIGQSNPTNRGVASGIWVNDWDGGIVTGNLLASYGDPTTIANVKGITIEGHNNDVIVTDNKLINIDGWPGDTFINIDDTVAQELTFSNNEIQLLDGSELIVLNTSNSGNTGYSGNDYWGPVSQDNWFTINDASVSISAYRSATGDNATAQQLEYVDKNRTIETYINYLGYGTTMSDFINEVTQQSKFRWRKILTADYINTYFREGYCLKSESCSELISKPVPPSLHIPSRTPHGTATNSDGC